MSELETTTHATIMEPGKPNWPHVAWFLGLTFGLSWLLDVVLYLNGGMANPATTLLLQIQMMMPAFSAMFLGAFFFKESPIYNRANRRTTRKTRSPGLDSGAARHASGCSTDLALLSITASRPSSISFSKWVSLLT